MLKVEKLSKTFNPGTINEKKALTELSLTLETGDFVTIVGSNGAGKSTLFNAVAGSFYPDAGRVELDGEDITFLPDYRRSKYIGRMFQDPLRGTAPSMTIEENMALAYLRASKRSSPFSRSIADGFKHSIRRRPVQKGLNQLRSKVKSGAGGPAGNDFSILYLSWSRLDLRPGKLLLQSRVADGLSALQQAPAAQEGGGGADGGHPDVLVSSLAHQTLHGGLSPQVFYPCAAARQDDHLRLGQVDFLQKGVGGYGDAVAAGDGIPLDGDQGRLDIGPAQQIGGHQGLRLLETGG